MAGDDGPSWEKITFLITAFQHFESFHYSVIRFIQHHCQLLINFNLLIENFSALLLQVLNVTQSILHYHYDFVMVSYSFIITIGDDSNFSNIHKGMKTGAPHLFVGAQ